MESDLELLITDGRPMQPRTRQVDCRNWVVGRQWGTNSIKP